MNWTIEKRKQGNEIWISSNVKPEAIFIGDGYEKKEYKRSMELAKVIVEALNKHETREITKKFSVSSKADELAMENFEKELKENDSGHQPC